MIKWTAEGAVKCIGSEEVPAAEYSATLKADVICRGYVGIPQSVWDPEKTGRTFFEDRKSRWHRE